MTRRRCCCPGCPCTADAAAALKAGIVSKSTITIDAPGSFSDTWKAVWAGYYASTWHWRMAYTPLGEFYIQMACVGDKWHVSGYIAKYGTPVCYYYFDEDVCPMPPPRVDGSGYFSGSFTLQSLTWNEAASEPSTEGDCAAETAIDKTLTFGVDP